MSSSATSGRESLQGGERLPAIVRDADLVALHPQQHGEALRGVAVVVGDEHAPAHERRGVALGRQALLTAALTCAAASAR